MMAGERDFSLLQSCHDVSGAHPAVGDETAGTRVWPLTSI